jgi:hypothetical protein
MTASARALRDALGIAAPVLWQGLALAPMLWMWDRLPEPMAVHWAVSGEPDGAMSRAAALAFFGVMTGVAGLIAFGVTRAPAPHRAIGPGLALTTFVGLFGAIIECVVVRLNLDAASWREARALPWTWLAFSLVAAAGAAAVTSRLAARLETAATAGDAATLPSIGLAATERAVWSGSAGNPWIATLALGLAGAGSAAFLLTREPAAVLTVATGCLLGLFAVVRVRVDERGLTVAYGPLGFPRQRMPLARIRSARVVRVVPVRQGGWGYRGSMLIFRRASIIVRAGPGIELDCGARGQLIITVDDGDVGAGLINDLVARSRAG